jgi:hypothetical protein
MTVITKIGKSESSSQEGAIQPLSQIGRSGLDTTLMSGFDFVLPKLRGTQGIKIFQEMQQTEPIIGATLMVYEMLARQAEWHVEPASDDPEAHAVSEFVESCFHDMSSSWHDTISEIMSMLTFGYAPFEIVYKLRGGLSGDPVTNSRHTDGRIGWRKLSIRSQDTLYEWCFDDNGILTGLKQMAPPRWNIVFIPIEKLLIFKLRSRKENPEGWGILTNAYRPWYFKRHIENIQGIGIERDLAGLPVVWVPEDMIKAEASPAQQAAYQIFKKMIKNIRRDEQEGIVMPLAYDEKGNKIYDLTLLSTGSRRQFDTTAILQNYILEMAVSMMTDFLLIGHEKVGSFALSSNKTNLFATSEGAILDIICEVFNRYGIPRLLEINNIDLKHAPNLVHGDIETPDLIELGDYIVKLVTTGMMAPDEKTESYLRRAANLPQKEMESLG